jgi:serpin B
MQVAQRWGMTKRSRLSALRSSLALLGLGLLSGACGRGDAHKPSQNDDADGVVAELRSDLARVTPSEAESKQASDAEQNFAVSFLHALAADKNVTFSPHSLSTAFAMLADAAGGRTLSEVEQTLKFGPTDEAFHRSQDALELALAQRNRNAIDEPERKVEAQILTASNDLWMRDDVPPQPSYLDTLARFYGAGVHHADFAEQPERVRVAINAKVAEDTNQLISELIPADAITSDTVSVLTNALYFKAPWANPFAAPTAGEFHALDGSTKSADMLRTRTHLRYAAGEGFVSVAVPYYGGDLEMMLIVPDSGAYESVRDQLTSEALSQLVSDGASEDVDLTLPKFKVQSIVPAAQTLQELGMATPFDPNTAEFPKLVSELYPVVYISDVLHQATVTIDEKGTEASAATAILTAGLSIGPIEQPQPKVVNVDRPFLFTIRDNPTGAVLFLGQIVRP